MYFVGQLWLQSFQRQRCQKPANSINDEASHSMTAVLYYVFAGPAGADQLASLQTLAAEKERHMPRIPKFVNVSRIAQKKVQKKKENCGKKISHPAKINLVSALLLLCAFVIRAIVTEKSGGYDKEQYWATADRVRNVFLVDWSGNLPSIPLRSVHILTRVNSQTSITTLSSQPTIFLRVRGISIGLVIGLKSLHIFDANATHTSWVRSSFAPSCSKFWRYFLRISAQRLWLGCLSVEGGDNRGRGLLLLSFQKPPTCTECATNFYSLRKLKITPKWLIF